MTRRSQVIHPRLRRARGAGIVLLASGLMSACTDAAGYDLDYILSLAPFIATMRTSVAYEPQSMPRMPAEGTVPVISPAGDATAPFTQFQLDSVGVALANPVPVSAEVIARGAVVYQNQCFVCHGAQGEGDGPVIGMGRFPMGPPVNNAVAAARSDGYLYGVIRVGRGLMPAYGERISHNDRWAVVHFLRELQQRAGTIVEPVGMPAPVDAPVATPAPVAAPDPAPEPGA